MVDPTVDAQMGLQMPFACIETLLAYLMTFPVQQGGQT